MYTDARVYMDIDMGIYLLSNACTYYMYIAMYVDLDIYVRANTLPSQCTNTDMCTYVCTHVVNESNRPASVVL